jgi:hypothetical protein
MAAVVLNGGVRLDRSQRAPLARAVARLLGELSLGGGERRLSRIDDASGNLERDAQDALPPLLDHHQLVGVGQRDDVNPVVGLQNVEVTLALGRTVVRAGVLAHAALLDPEDATIEERLRSLDGPRGHESIRHGDLIAPAEVERRLEPV